MAINIKRAENFKRKNDNDLIKIYKSGSLSSAAAFYELRNRGKLGKLNAK